MGYYTRYTVRANVLVNGGIGELLDTATANAIEKTINERYFNDTFGLNDKTEETKWYEWENDMSIVSKKFPHILFTVEGIGEESGDIWQCFICNGQFSERFKPSMKFEYGDFDQLKFFTKNLQEYIPSLEDYEKAKKTAATASHIIQLYERSKK